MHVSCNFLIFYGVLLGLLFKRNQGCTAKELFLFYRERLPGDGEASIDGIDDDDDDGIDDLYEDSQDDGEDGMLRGNILVDRFSWK